MALPEALQGEAWTAQMGRRMLPLLVLCAQEHRSITYGEVDREAQRRHWGNHVFPTNYGKAAGAIAARTAEGLEKVVEEVVRAIRPNECQVRRFSSLSDAPSAANLQPTPNLTDSARELLLEASQDPKGVIKRLETMEGLQVHTNNRDFAVRAHGRASARWSSAVDELRRFRLIEDRKGRGQVFFVTDAGYCAADILREQ